MSFANNNNLFSVAADDQAAPNDGSLSRLVDVNLTDEVRKYRTKLKKCLTDSDSISLDELKHSSDLTLHRDWFIKLFKYVNKMQEAANDDFFDTVDQFESLKDRLRYAEQRNAELEGTVQDLKNVAGAEDDQFKSHQMEQEKQELMQQLQNQSSQMAVLEGTLY